MLSTADASLHGGPPGSRGLTISTLKENHWVLDPSHHRFDRANPGAWRDIKVMTVACPHRKSGQTHICVCPTPSESCPNLVCGMTFTCNVTSKFSGQEPSSRGVAFINTPAAQHRKQYHGKRTAKRKHVDTVQLLGMAAAGQPTPPSESHATTSIMAQFVAKGMAAAALSKAINQKAKVCRWLVFSRTPLSFNMLTDEYFVDMLRSGDPNFSKLRPADVNDWVVKTFHLFLLMLGHVLNDLERKHCGNPFWQALHDGVTVSHVKFQAVGMQFEWENTNWLVNIGFCRCLNSTAQEVSQLLNQCLDTPAGWGFLGGVS